MTTPNVLPQGNVKMSLQGTKLVIEIELENVDKLPSGSGKSLMIATTSGNHPVPVRPDITLGLNCYTSIKK